MRIGKTTLSSLLCLAIAACNMSPKPASELSDARVETTVTPAADGAQLERDMWLAIEAKDWPAVEARIAEGFQSAHSDGARDRAGEMELIRGLNAVQPRLGDFKVTEQVGTIIVTYTISVEETIDGKVLSSAPAVRQSVWQHSPAGWQWIAHANLKALQDS